MSDQTSDTTTGAEASAGEPSMDDILASIRRIIAEDDVQESVTTSAMGDTPAEESKDDDVLVLNATVEDGEVLELSDIADIAIPEAGEAAGAEFNPVSQSVSDLESKLSEPSVGGQEAAASALDDLNIFDDIELVLNEKEPQVQPAQDDIASSLDDILEIVELEDSVAVVEEDLILVTPEPESEISDDLDGLLSEIDDLSFDDDASEQPTERLEVTEDIVSVEEIMDLTDEDVHTESDSVSVSSESDLDLVKALMADLTDTSFLDTMDDDASAAEANLDISELTEIDLPVEAADADIIEMAIPDPVSAPVDSGDQDQILNDILDLALQDQEDQVMSDLELSLDTEPLKAADDGFGVSDTNLLLQLAAQVEADAKAAETSDEESLVVDEIIETVETPSLESTDDILSELDMALAEVSDEDTEDQIPEEIFETVEIEEPSEDAADLFIEPQAEPPQQETQDMAKAARNETILDDVTETASADAFASLSQAVEDKAVFTESGPRIGDLVQDALRPMLKEWLDENLKSIVERAVAKEVKRISSGK